jgi:hypothetical protein
MIEINVAATQLDNTAEVQDVYETPGVSSLVPVRLSRFVRRQYSDAGVPPDYMTFSSLS